MSRQVQEAPDRRPDRQRRLPAPQDLEPWAEPVAADRLLLFSDAVFAISATLLVLDIGVPSGLGPDQFTRALAAQLPAIAAYAFSFGVIGQLWLFHHRIFGFIASVDTPILVRSLVLLALIAFMPFPVRLLSDYHDQPAAVAVYMATFTLATTVQRLLWVYATGQPHLLARPVPEEVRRRYNLVLTTMPLGFGVLVPISLLAPRVAIGVWLLLLAAGVVVRRLELRPRRLPSRRDRGMTALIEGFFGFVWFGWGQANASAGLTVVLAVGGVLAVAVAIAGGVQAFRSPRADSVLHDRRAWRRYGLVVGVEFALAGVGAAALAAAGQSDLVPVWVCAVVAVHLFPLASLLRDRLLVPLGALLAVVALAALVAALATGVPASTVTGLGAGVLLALFAAIALAGVGRR